MATRIYKVSPGMTEFQVIEGVGSATASNTIELTVDLGSSIITDSNVTGGVRSVKKEEVLMALDQIKNHILVNNWNPA